MKQSSEKQKFIIEELGMIRESSIKYSMHKVVIIIICVNFTWQQFNIIEF